MCGSDHHYLKAKPVPMAYGSNNTVSLPTPRANAMHPPPAAGFLTTTTGHRSQGTNFGGHEGAKTRRWDCLGLGQHQLTPELSDRLFPAGMVRPRLKFPYQLFQVVPTPHA